MQRDATFDAAVASQVPVLRRYARSLTTIDVDDLVHDAVAKALANAALFDGANLAAWMVTILRNEFLMRVRKRRREVEDADGVIASAIPVPGGQQSVVELRETMKLVRRLPKEQREALMIIMGGADYAEAAERLGVPEGTVKSRVSRARAALEGDEQAESGDPQDRVMALIDAGKRPSEIMKEIDGIEREDVIMMWMRRRPAGRAA